MSTVHVVDFNGVSLIAADVVGCAADKTRWDNTQQDWRAVVFVRGGGFVRVDTWHREALARVEAIAASRAVREDLRR